MTLYGLIPVLSLARIAQPIDRNYKLFMLWGGMRGAVSLALALAATENMSLPPEIRQFVGVLATGFVLFTLLVTAPTMRPLMRLLKLSDASPADIALRERVIGLSLSSIREEIETVGREHRIAPEIVDEITAIYDAHSRDPAEIAEENAQLPAEIRTRAAISVLADREQEFCLEYFEGRTVSRRVAASLLAHAARLRDGARSQGVEGYQQAAARLRRVRRRPTASPWRCTGGSASPVRSRASSPTGSRSSSPPASCWKISRRSTATRSAACSAPGRARRWPARSSCA